MRAILDSSRAEWLRMRRWPAVWVTLGIWLFLGLMFGYIFNYFSYRTGETGFSNEGVSQAQIFTDLMPVSVPDVLLQGTPMFGGALMMVLGALVAGSGYGWGSWKTVFTQGPSRSSVIAGSLLTLACFVAGLVLVTLALFFGVSTAIALTEGTTIAWPAAGSVAQAALAAFLVLGLWALAGYAVGTVARGPALAVGLGLVWSLVVEPLLRGVGSVLGPVEALTHLLPGTAAGSLVGSIIGVRADSNPGVLDVLSGTRATWTALAYLVVLPLVTVTVVRRRDVT